MSEQDSKNYRMDKIVLKLILKSINHKNRVQDSEEDCGMGVKNENV